MQLVFSTISFFDPFSAQQAKSDPEAGTALALECESTSIDHCECTVSTSQGSAKKAAPRGARPKVKAILQM